MGRLGLVGVCRMCCQRCRSLPEYPCLNWWSGSWFCRGGGRCHGRGGFRRSGFLVSMWVYIWCFFRVRAGEFFCVSRFFRGGVLLVIRFFQFRLGRWLRWRGLVCVAGFMSLLCLNFFRCGRFSL